MDDLFPCVSWRRFLVTLSVPYLRSASPATGRETRRGRVCWGEYWSLPTLRLLSKLPMYPSDGWREESFLSELFHTLSELFYEMVWHECLVPMSSVASHPSLFSTSLVNTTPLAIDFVVELIVPHSFHHVDGNPWRNTCPKVPYKVKYTPGVVPTPTAC